MRRQFARKDITRQESFNFDIDIVSVPVLILAARNGFNESLEGNRGEARNLPPYTVNKGFNGFPTLLIS
jgi:[NiFe] hydrogenase diaphorase moiety large subunit